MAGNAGVPFDAHDPDDLAAKIQHLVDHPEEAEENRRRSVKRIEDYYDWDRVADLTEELCRDLLEGHPKPGMRWVPDAKPAADASRENSGER